MERRGMNNMYNTMQPLFFRSLPANVMQWQCKKKKQTNKTKQKTAKNSNKTEVILYFLMLKSLT